MARMNEEDRREQVRAAILAGRIDFAPGVEDVLGRMNFDEPDFTLTKVEVDSCWGPFQRGGHGNDGGFDVHWETASAGCGRITFHRKDGKLHCYNQGMSRAFIVRVLARMVDDSILSDPEPDEPTEEEPCSPGTG